MAELTETRDRLLEPVGLGGLRLRNRIIMAPLTRMRVGADFRPFDFLLDYYVQRASAGLIITESIAVAPYGPGWGNLPGLWEDAHVQAWARIVNGVHAKNGLIVAQLFHAAKHKSEDACRGRPPGWAVIEPIYPNELSLLDIARVVAEYADGARRAKEAGFDGIEIHCGTGTMLSRFLHEGSNRREDRYGGSARRRVALLLEILEAVSKHYPLDHVAVKLAPSALVDGAPDPTAKESFATVLAELEPAGLSYIEVTRVTREESTQGYGEGIPLSWVRSHYSGRILGVNGFSREDGEEAVATGVCDGIVYGRLFISNPDLPYRFVKRASLTPWDETTFYSNGPEGLIDYLALEDA